MNKFDALLAKSIGDMLAVRYERQNLDQAICQNDHATIQYAAEKSPVHDLGKEPAKKRGGPDWLMERARDMSPHLTKKERNRT